MWTTMHLDKSNELTTERKRASTRLVRITYQDFCVVGLGHMKIDARSLYREKQKDMEALLDALQELFQEHKNKVTPK
jgi:hypothetical protein